MGKLICCYCFHRDEPEDRVAYYHVGGKGDVAQCVDSEKCEARQKKAREPKVLVEA